MTQSFQRGPVWTSLISAAFLIWSSVMCLSISLSVHLCFSLKLYKAFTGSEASSGKDDGRVLPEAALPVFVAILCLHACITVCARLCVAQRLKTETQF